MKILILLFTVSAACGLAPQIVADSIRLHPAALVNGTAVTLADVATLDGPAAEAFATLKLDDAADGVALAEVRRLLTDAGADWSALTLTGHARCDVALQTEAPADAIPAVAPIVSEPPVGGIVGHVTVADLIRRRFAELNAVDAKALQITFPDDPDQRATLGRDADDGRYELVPTTRTGLGRVPIRVLHYDAAGTVTESAVTVDVARRASVVTAAYDVRRDERLTETNLKVREVLLSGDAEQTFTEAADVIGKRARAPLREGAVIQANDLVEELLIERGDLVTVSAIRGRLVVRTVARATEDASLGEAVALRHDDTRETFYATVSGRRAASITQPATTPATVAAAPR